MVCTIALEVKNMKLCRSCNTEKDTSLFGKRAASNDGLSPKCKKCQSSYDKARANNPDRVAAREAYQKTEAGIESVNKAKKKWVANNKDKIYETTKVYRKNNPNKYKAHGKVAYEIRIGNLSKKPCEECGEISGVNAHHDDYSKPLDIRWLCSTHHKQWHAINGEGANG
jgi:hypothetical protein